MILRIDIYAPFLVEVDTIIFLVYNNLLITSRTVVFLIEEICYSKVIGV